LEDERDPLGYYRVLGLAPNATQAQIAHAYREWAKTSHPDVTGKPDTAEFIRIKTAYDTLNDPARRARYDSQKNQTDSAKSQGRSKESEQDAKPRRTPREAVRCSGCGSISAQPRYCVFDRVAAIVLYTRIEHPQGVYCPTCAKKRALRASLFSWLFGWWSIHGIIYTPIALWKNFWLGEKPALPNARLLISQGLYFFEMGQNEIANSCFQQAQRYASGEDAEFITIVRDSARLGTVRSLRNHWGIFRDGEFVKHLMPFVPLALAAAFLFSGDSDALGTNTHAAGPPTHVRYVSAPVATAWIENGGAFVNGGLLNRFTTVRMIRPASDPKFSIALLPDGRTAAIENSLLANGDGSKARLKWCSEQPQYPPFNNEILKQTLIGHNEVVVHNRGNSDAVVKFRTIGGSVVLSYFVAENSTATVRDFPDGTYTLEFATGSSWSRDCGLFINGMRIQRFPAPDTFTTTQDREMVRDGVLLHTYHDSAEYTITPVTNGNVRAQTLDLEAFLRE
jgi:curved DNA-binding protein CbpA